MPSIARIELLRPIFEDPDIVEARLNSEKRIKRERLIKLLALVVPELAVVLAQEAASLYIETDYPDSEVVALDKAEYVKRDSISRGAVAVGIGADTRFMIRTPNGYENWAKLDRLNHPLNEEDLYHLYDLLYELFVNPKWNDGFINLGWEISLAAVNGSRVVVTEFVFIKSKAIPKDLFDIKFWAAVKSGLLYKSNARFDLIETLIEASTIQQVGIVEMDAYRKNGEEAISWMSGDDSFLKRKIMLDILATIPELIFSLEESRFLVNGFSPGQELIT